MSMILPKVEESAEEDFNCDKSSYTAAPPAGLLSIHIKKIQNLVLHGNLFPTKDISLYVRVKVGKIAKCTKTVESVCGKKPVIIDDLRNFTLVVSRKLSDPSNNIKIDMIGFETGGRHLVIGRKELHLYDVIKNQFVAGVYDLTFRSELVGGIELEFCFTYGIFGYSFSHQLDNRQKSVADTTTHSFLYRVQPPDNRMQPNTPVMSALPVGHPDFIEFDEIAEIGTTARVLGSVAEEVNPFSDLPVIVPTMMPKLIKRRLQRLQLEYKRQTSRKERLKFLEKIILKHTDHHADETMLQGEPDESNKVTGDQASHNPLLTDFKASLLDDHSEHDLDTMKAFIENAPGIVTRGRYERTRYNFPPDLVDVSGSSVESESSQDTVIESKEVENVPVDEPTPEVTPTPAGIPATVMSAVNFITNLMGRLRGKKQPKKAAVTPVSTPQSGTRVPVPLISVEQASPETSTHSMPIPPDDCNPGTSEQTPGDES